MFPATRNELTKGEKPVFYPIRRARGYAPDPVRLSFEAPPLFAAGAELKNTFCLTRGRYAFLSHHIGDMENNETLLSFEQSAAHFERLFRIQPEAIAYDLHPNYLATRYAVERAERECLPAIGVQHHHAHIAACMAENGLSGERPVIGVAFDGTGYGDDEAIWGGEFLVADYASYQRAAHLAYARLPGGDKAVREPWRMALAWLQATGIPWEDDLPPMRYAASLADQPIPPLKVLARQLESGLNAPLTSSMGRLFDAAAALVGVRQTVNYEAQAAIEMEAIANMREPGYYPMALQGELIDPAPMLQGMIADLRNGVSQPILAARFHSGIAQMVLDTCLRLRKQFDIDEVALSGGVWQNTFLLSLTVGLLQENEFKVILHRQVPTNDGGLALGQAVVAIARLRNGSL
jgi:hydrogenase maturation protein HypF